MNKKLIILLVIIGIAAVLILPTLFQAAQYGISGVPQVVLLTPACDSVVSSTPSFAFRAEPDPSMYDHYLLQVKTGTEWDGDNIVEEKLTMFEYVLTTPLDTGIYQYNIVAVNTAGEKVAGSSPCTITVE